VSLSADSIPRLDEVRVDGRVLAFSTALSIGIGVACGLVASLSIDALNPRSGFRISGAAAGAQGRGFRQTVTVVEIAVALMLVIAAGLLVRTMRVVSGLDLGFDRRNVLAIGLSPDRTKYPSARARLAFEEDVLAGVRALPEVIAAGIGSSPLRGGGGGLGTRVTLASDPGTLRQIAVDVVSSGYLDALGVRLLSGRFFADGDAQGTPRVAIVNDVAARRFWPDRSAIGQSVIRDDREAQIVGVIGDVRRQDLEADPEPTLYLPSAQTPNMSTGHMLVRTAGDPRESLPAIREVLRRIDPEVPLSRVRTLDELLGRATASRRQILWLAGLFSLMSVALALVGVYSVMAESVAQRVPEIGVRMALGATTADIVRLIVRQGGTMAVLGIGGGLVGAYALNRVMAGFVFRVPTTDPATYFFASAVLVAATLAACGVPARRAARVDPVLALRHE
jgi:putative ABC transport system permease protein